MNSAELPKIASANVKRTGFLMKPTPTESQIKKEILSWLRLQPETFAFAIYSVGIPDFNRRGGFRRNPNRGVSDILGVKSGKFFAFEVKRPVKKASPAQLRFLKNVDDAAGYSAVVFSLDDAQHAWREI